MKSTAPLHDEKRKWYYLSLRHLRIASRLLNSGFADGAVFHLYHAYECGASSLIAAQNYQVPPAGWKTITVGTKTQKYYPSPKGKIMDASAHVARLRLFNEVADRTKRYYARHKILFSFMTPTLRNNALYYDPVRNMLPEQVHNLGFAKGLYPQVKLFIKDLRPDIN